MKHTTFDMNKAFKRASLAVVAILMSVNAGAKANDIHATAQLESEIKLIPLSQLSTVMLPVIIEIEPEMKIDGFVTEKRALTADSNTL